VFVAWGAYHGILLSLNRAFQREWERFPRAVRRITVFLLVVVGWVLFRSRDFPMAASLLHRMFWLEPSPVITALGALVALLAVALAFAHFGKNTFEMTHQWSLAMRCIWLAALAVCLVRIMTWEHTPFLYFQF